MCVVNLKIQNLRNNSQMCGLTEQNCNQTQHSNSGQKKSQHKNLFISLWSKLNLIKLSRLTCLVNYIFNILFIYMLIF